MRPLSIGHTKWVRSFSFAFFILLALGLGFGLASRSTAESTAEVSHIYLPTIYYYDTTRDRSIFGVQLYGNTLPTNKYYNDLVESGTVWIRIPVRWRDAESVRQASPKTYDWTAIDRVLAAAIPSQHPFKIIGTVYHAPDWAVPEPYHERAVLNDDALSDFAEFTQALAARYSGQHAGLPVVTHWEFYNEPDITSEPGGTPLWGDNGDKYAEMLAAVYPAIKAGNPRAQVVFGGIAYDAFVDQGGTFVREFLDDVLTAGGGQYFDVMNFHFYPGFAPNWTGQEWPLSGPGLYEKAAFIRTKLEQEYGLYKPMVITEAGWYSDAPPFLPSSPEIQSRYVVKLHMQSIAADIRVMIWWMLYDAGIGYNETGLVTNGTPPVRKPAFGVYQTLVEEMKTAQFVRRLSDAETENERLEVYQFADGAKNRTLYVAWLNVADHSSTETAVLRLPVPNLRIKAMEGHVVQMVNDGEDGQADGWVTVSVSNRPIYLEVTGE